MRNIVLGVLVLVACTKPNPNVCCTDEADCTTKGIPVGSQCEEGLLCRGNQCIAQPCSSSASCDSAAPYCVADSCAESCTEDAQCPGFSQAAEQRFCESAACVACRVDVPADCVDSAPVCDQGRCRTCQAHAECSSGVCASDGTCAAENSIAYVEAGGAATSECTRASPCSTIVRALAILPTRSYILIGSGTYAADSTITFKGTRALIGRGPTKPIVSRTTAGPIFTFGLSTDALFQNLQISGATSSGTEYGIGILCDGHNGTAMVRLRDTTVTQNASNALQLPACSFDITNSVVTDNGGGLYHQDTQGTIDRSIVSGNGSGIEIDGGVYVVTNNIITRNRGNGINLFSASPNNRVEFNTIVDNSGANTYGFTCQVQGASASFPNNIIARNTLQTIAMNCTFPNSIIADTNISSLAFRSPDVQPYDYHLTAGSVAIDAASVSTLGQDYDGQARPNGNGRDVGADEFYP